MDFAKTASVFDDDYLAESILFWMEFLNRYDAGDHFSSEELEEMIFDCDKVEEHRGDCHRWTQSVTTIFKVEDRYFRIYWQRGLTEYQENEYYNQPEEVVLHEYEKVVHVKEWVSRKRIDACAFNKDS